MCNGLKEVVYISALTIRSFADYQWLYKNPSKVAVQNSEQEEEVLNCEGLKAERRKPLEAIHLY